MALILNNLSVLCALQLLCLVYGQNTLSTVSLTFVIDSTGSMGDDIYRVKQEVNAIFDIVTNSKESQIENFVLVTFNDPDVKLLTITKDRNIFKTALESITVDGGGDCPEMSMGGIERALQVSQPGSYVYVFTDASAKDYSKYEAVKMLAVEKGSQVVFILTGECYGESIAQTVYYSLASESQGQVFNLHKNEVGTILNYVKETIKKRKIVIVPKTFPPGSHEFDFTVDGTMKELVVSVSGKSPTIALTDPEGHVAETEDVVRTSRIAIVKVTEVKPGVYTAQVSSDTDTSVVVSGTNTVHFQHGFSVLEPISIEETAAQPIPGEKSYLAIKLITEGGAVELQSVQAVDMDQKIISDMPLELINVKDQFYITEPFVPPNTSFRIAIKGYDVISKTVITRFGLIPIEPQNPKKVSTTNKAPVVNVIGKSKVHVLYEESLQLKCKVSGYPKPTITWEDEVGVISSSSYNVTLISIPYDYVTFLDIDVINNNNTYRCKASNDLGKDSKEIEIKVKRTTYFDILDTPKDKTVEHGKEAQFFCKINASPYATIKWFRQGKTITENDYFHISSDNSTLTIKKMQPYLVGKYWCKVKNDFNRKVFIFKVSVSGIELPKIDKSVEELYVRERNDVNITCRILQGRPKPTIRWFFQPEYSRSLQQINGGEIIHVTNIKPENAGTFRCEAYNVAGEDFHYIELFVEYPPSIAEGAKVVKAIENERIQLPCDIDGVPEPEVQWLLNGVKIPRSRIYRYHRDYSISFIATVGNDGTYTCKATNNFGTASKTTIVQVNVPATIEPPKETTKEVTVGEDLTLDCLTDGHPKPDIEWIFYSFDYSIPPKVLKNNPTNSYLDLPRIQIEKEGYYTCIASNIGGSDNITYEVLVLSPPYIKDIPEKKYISVLGDLTLRLQCNAMGNPTPIVHWHSDGFNLTIGSDWYDIEKDGTLVIKNVKLSDAGSYTCLASNKMGSASETYDVYVEPYPPPGTPTLLINIEEGKSSRIPCDVPYKKTDVLRWFKNNKNIGTGELTLRNVTTIDSGLYTCRVSNFYNSKTGHTRVVVGYKPKFLYNKETQIEFEDGVSAVMDCSASGNPPPMITWWHDNQRINEKSMTYVLNMKLNKRGQYFCVVKNVYGYIVRSFKISSRECLLDMKEDFKGNQPLLLSTDYKWALFYNIDGFMSIPQHTNIILSCQDGFTNYNKSEILGTCKQGANFEIGGTTVNYSSMKCKKPMEPITKETGIPCWSGNTDTIKIGYMIRDKFLEVYQICIDKDKNVPIYAKHNIHRSMAVTDVNSAKWFKDKLVPFNFDDLYDCNRQINGISAVLGRWFHRNDQCCFSKRQLVNSRDVSPGLSQLATYSHLNIIPQWSTCNVKNWESIERRVRRLARSTDKSLLVWTGTSQLLQINGSRGMETIYIRDSSGQQQPVPKFIWKVIQNPESQASLAIVQVNVPDVRLSEAHSYVLCPDICSSVPWMKSSSWRSVDRGYTYCCRIRDFESAFRYKNLFNSGLEKVLYDI